MLQQPRLKKFLTIFPISETTWGLRGGSDELWRVKLRDEQALNAFTNVLPYLNGKYTTEALLSAMTEKGVNAAEVSLLLEQMEEAYLLEEADTLGLSEEEEETFRSQLSFFSRYTAEGGAKYQARLRACRVGVIGSGYLGRSLMRQLRESGFGELLQLSQEPAAETGEIDGRHVAAGNGSPDARMFKLDGDSIWPSDTDEPLPALFIVAQEAEDPRLLDAMDGFSKSRKVPWMLVRAMESNFGWVGPLFIPDETACYRSLEARIRSNVSYFPEYEAFSRHLRQTREASATCGGLHAFYELISSIAVIETIKLVCNLSVPSLAGRFLTINLANWEVEAHDVLRVPQLGLEVTEPKLFSWKEMPTDEIAAHKEGSIFSRRF